MTLFEYIVSASLGIMAFTALWNWVEWQISQLQEREEGS